MKDIISNRRKELGLTQQELAKKVQVSDKVVSKWETGRSLSDTSMLMDLADALQLSINDLLNIENEKQNKLKETNMREITTKFKNFFIITMTIQIIAAILISVGRILLYRVQYYGQHEYDILCYILIVFAVLVEIVAISYALVTRNNLLNKYSKTIDIDKKYINLLLLFTYFTIFAVLLIFIAYHGLSDMEQFIALAIFFNSFYFTVSLESEKRKIKTESDGNPSDSKYLDCITWINKFSFFICRMVLLADLKTLNDI